jgi:hypothetical protein
MNKDDMTPYDLACMMAMQGLLASDLSGKARNAPTHTAIQAMQCVDALFAELDRKRRSK